MRSIQVIEKNGKLYFQRLTLNQRIQHVLLFVSFTLLAATGLPLKFHSTWWGPKLIRPGGRHHLRTHNPPHQRRDYDRNLHIPRDLRADRLLPLLYCSPQEEGRLNLLGPFWARLRRCPWFRTSPTSKSFSEFSNTSCLSPTSGHRWCFTG